MCTAYFQIRGSMPLLLFLEIVVLAKLFQIGKIKNLSELQETIDRLTYLLKESCLCIDLKSTSQSKLVMNEEFVCVIQKVTIKCKIQNQILFPSASQLEIRYHRRT